MPVTYSLGAVPRFSSYLLPEDERELASYVSDGLSDLASIVDEVEAAVELFNYTSNIYSSVDAEYRRNSENRHNKQLEMKSATARYWPFIAARSVAIATHDFRLAKGTINQTWPKLPTLKTMIDGAAVNRANKLFNEYFPRTEAMRDAACHSAERSRTPQELADHAAVLKPGGARLSIGSCLSGNKLQYTYKKRSETVASLLELEISAATVARLAEVRDLYFSGFAGIEPELMRRAKAEWQERQDKRLAEATQREAEQLGDQNLSGDDHPDRNT